MKLALVILFTLAVTNAQSTQSAPVCIGGVCITVTTTTTVSVLPQPASVTPATVLVQPSDPLDASFIPAQVGSAPANVWMTGPLAKVYQNAGAPGAAHAITTYAAKNEIQSFQIHVQAGAAAIPALSVTMSDLVNAKTGERISAASTDIVVFREAYMNVTIETAGGLTFLNAIGQIPDILIPAVDPYYHQTTNAFPFTVAAGNNQSVWVDVHVPPAVSSGYYAGVATVLSGTAALATLPVTYAVWNWAMPSTASLPSYTAIGYGGMCVQAYGGIPGCSAYPGSQGGADLGTMMTQVDAATQMLDNRYSIGSLGDTYPGSGDFTSFTATYGAILGGIPGHVPAILKGAKLTSWGIAVLSGQLTQATFQNFQTTFAKNGWVTPFFFLVDEPTAAQWTSIISPVGTEVHSFNTGTQTIVTTDLPTALANNMQNLIDVLVVNLVSLESAGPGETGLQSLPNYAAWIAAAPTGAPKRAFWSYQACSDSGTCGNGVSGSVQAAQGYPNTYPNYNIDGTPVANRVMEWLTFLHGQTGELYYNVEVCDYQNGVSANCGTAQPGLTASPLNPLISDYYSGGWGDGTLIYPGTPTYAGVTTPIWLPSLRLKMIRDGMQDYEYLNALTKAGQGAFATQQLQSWVTNSYTFNNDPAALLAARSALGNKLHQLSLQ
jgi:hypothetical protein